MKKIIIATTLLVLFACGSQDAENPIIAAVNNHSIYESDLRIALRKTFTPQQLSQFKNSNSVTKLRPEVLQTLIRKVAADKLLVEEAEKNDLQDKVQINHALDQAYATILKNAWLRELGRNLVTENQILVRYHKLTTRLTGKKEYKVKYILADSKQRAERIVKQASSKSFERFAEKFSQDKFTAKRGGNIGYVIPEHLGPVFSQAISSIKPGKLSKPFETKRGWHIALVEDVRDAIIPPFDKARASITNQLKKEALELHVRSLLENSNIEIFVLDNTDESTMNAVADRDQ